MEFDASGFVLPDSQQTRHAPSVIRHEPSRPIYLYLPAANLRTSSLNHLVVVDDGILCFSAAAKVANDDRRNAIVEQIGE